MLITISKPPDFFITLPKTNTVPLKNGWFFQRILLSFGGKLGLFSGAHFAADSFQGETPIFVSNIPTFTGTALWQGPSTDDGILSGNDHISHQTGKPENHRLVGLYVSSQEGIPGKLLGGWWNFLLEWSLFSSFSEGYICISVYTTWKGSIAPLPCGLVYQGYEKSTFWGWLAIYFHHVCLQLFESNQPNKHLRWLLKVHM